MGKLIKGEFLEVPKPKRTWWIRAWDYSINGVILGRIYKQEYPGSKLETVYRFDLHGLKLIPFHWKEVPKGKVGIVSDHYASKKEAAQAIKDGLKTYIKLFKSLEI